MTSWIVVSRGCGGTLYLPTDPYGMPDYGYMWAPWTPLLGDSIQRFPSKEAADAHMVALALEGFSFEDPCRTFEAQEE